MSNKRSKEARDNARNFYKMLKRKRSSMTDGEFRVWMNTHHARTDPYSYQQTVCTPQWRSISRNSSWSTISNGTYYRSTQKKSVVQQPQYADRYRFYGCREKLTGAEQQWRRTLRVYS